MLAPGLRDAYDLSLSGVGVVLASIWVGAALTLLPWGLLADRVGERAVLAAGLGACGVALAAAPQAPSFATLVLLLAFAGAAGASVNAASGRAVMHWFGAEERGFALGLRQTAVPLGGLAAALALPAAEQGGGLQAAFLILTGLCLAGAAAGVAVIHEPPTREPEHAAAPWTLRDRRLWRLSLAGGLYVVAQMALTGFVVLFLHDERGFSVGSAAGVLAALHVLAAAMRIAAGRWSDALGARRVAPLRAIGLAMFATVMLSAVLLEAPSFVLVPALVLAGALSSAWNGLSFTAAAELAGEARSGAAIGVQQTVLTVVAIPAPVAFATLVDVTSWAAAFALVALCPLAGWLVLGKGAERERVG